MKKFMFIAVVSAMVVFASSCGGKNEVKDNEQPTEVVADSATVAEGDSVAAETDSATQTEPEATATEKAETDAPA